MNPLAVVTGASAGIGAAFARQLAERGYDLALVARRTDRLAELARELETPGRVRAEILSADLTRDTDLRFIEDRLRGAPNLEFLVNNAGYGFGGGFLDNSADTHDHMHRLHITATLRLTYAALGGMVERRRGAIVNVSSVAAFWQTAGAVSYSATKAWINSFSQGVYLEMKRLGVPVKVQALCPGFTVTEFHDVMGVDRKVIPGWLWMPVEGVVEASLRGLEKDQFLVVPGLRYRLIAAAARLTPWPVRRYVASRYGLKFRHVTPRGGDSV